MNVLIRFEKIDAVSQAGTACDRIDVEKSLFSTVISKVPLLLNTVNSDRGEWRGKAGGGPWCCIQALHNVGRTRDFPRCVGKGLV